MLRGVIVGLLAARFEADVHFGEQALDAVEVVAGVQDGVGFAAGVVSVGVGVSLGVVSVGVGVEVSLGVVSVGVGVAVAVISDGVGVGEGVSPSPPAPPL